MATVSFYRKFTDETSKRLVFLGWSGPEIEQWANGDDSGEIPTEGCANCGWEEYEPLCPSCQTDADRIAELETELFEIRGYPNADFQIDPDGTVSVWASPRNNPPAFGYRKGA